MAVSYTIGILGGMGPEATNRLCALITELTPVARDQDHVPVITYNNSQIPSRVAAVRNQGLSPVAEMRRTARVLEQAGAQMLLTPCNLAHFYLDEVQESVSIPFVNMVEETARFIAKNYPEVRKVGILASTATIECGIYEKAFGESGRALVVPEAVTQEEKVMRAIYGPEGIKCGHKTRPRAWLLEAASELAARGAEIIVAACTEVSLVLSGEELSFAVVDSLEVLARAALEKALPGAEENVHGGLEIFAESDDPRREVSREQDFDDDGGRARFDDRQTLRREVQGR